MDSPSARTGASGNIGPLASVPGSPAVTPVTHHCRVFGHCRRHCALVRLDRQRWVASASVATHTQAASSSTGPWFVEKPRVSADSGQCAVGSWEWEVCGCVCLLLFLPCASDGPVRATFWPNSSLLPQDVLPPFPGLHLLEHREYLHFLQSDLCIDVPVVGVDPVLSANMLTVLSALKALGESVAMWPFLPRLACFIVSPPSRTTSFVP